MRGFLLSFGVGGRSAYMCVCVCVFVSDFSHAFKNVDVTSGGEVAPSRDFYAKLKRAPRVKPRASQVCGSSVWDGGLTTPWQFSFLHSPIFLHRRQYITSIGAKRLGSVSGLAYLPLVSAFCFSSAYPMFIPTHSGRVRL